MVLLRLVVEVLGQVGIDTPAVAVVDSAALNFVMIAVLGRWLLVLGHAGAWSLMLVVESTVEGPGLTMADGCCGGPGEDPQIQSNSY